MFIIEPIKKDDATGELKLFYETIEKAMGFIPPHFEVFATIDLPSMQEFTHLNIYMMTHPKIARGLLPILRLYIAKKECKGYCINFNTNILTKMEIDKEIIADLENRIDDIPFEENQKTLLKKVFKALEEPKDFGEDDLKELYKLGFSDKDFFDLLNYASEFSAKSKMIEVYLR